MYPPLPGASSDAWTLTRVVAKEVDGIVKDVPDGVAAGVCAFGWTSPREQAYAARTNAVLDATITTSEPAGTFRNGDHLTVRGTTFRIVAARQLRLHTRVTLAHLTSEGR